MKSLGFAALMLIAASGPVLAFSTGPVANVCRTCNTAVGCDVCHAGPRPTDTLVEFELAAPMPGPLPPSGYIPDSDYSFILRVVERALAASSRTDRVRGAQAGCLP